ncbi:MAG: hypothetical protein SGCHY_003154 [Lobulomycetales sp.]
MKNAFDLLALDDDDTRPEPVPDIVPSTEVSSTAELGRGTADAVGSRKIGKKPAKKQSLDDIVDRIESSDVKLKPKNLCHLGSCKERVPMMQMGLCSFCKFSYCMKHRLPEIHAPDGCGNLASKSAKSNFRSESARVSGLQKRADGGNESAQRAIRKSGGNLVAAANRDNEEAAKRLKEKIASAKSNRTRNGGKGSK